MIEDKDSVEPDKEQQPRGAFVLALGFLVLIVVLWAWTYSELLGRI